MTKKTICLFNAILLIAMCVVGNKSQPQSTSASNSWEAEIRKFEEADQKSPPPKGAVLFVGSSSIKLWRDLEKDFPNTTVINRGFGGSQIQDSTYYANRIVVPYRPRLIVLYAGDNDLASGKTPARVFEDYQRFVRKVRQRLSKVRIAYIAIKPSPARWQLVPAMKTANAMIEHYTSGEERLTYIDVFTPMLGADGKPRAELYAADGLHLSEAGYALWTKVIAPYLK